MQPSSYSRSVIGHKALVETLRRLGIPVLASRFESASKAGDGGLLVVAVGMAAPWYAAMDAIAVEIERISEGQRFVTRLLSESQGNVPTTQRSGEPATVPARDQNR